MKNINLFIICLLSLFCSLMLFAQNDESYTLDFQQKIRPQFISDVTFNGEKGYLFIQAISNYSPETYPNLITDVAIQQTMIGQNFRVLIKSDTDFNSVSISPPITNNMRNVIAVDGEVYFTSNDSVNEGGAVNFFKWGIDGVLEVYTELPFVSGNMDGFITYYDNKFYFLTYQYYNQEIDEIILGKLFVLDLCNDQMTHYDIGDPTAANVIYRGIAIDETGIYVSGTAVYVSAITGITPSQDFYYTDGAFQPCMTCNTIAMNASFLTSYNTANPEIRNWSTYVGGTGSITLSPGSSGSLSKKQALKIIDGDLYMLDVGVGLFSNFTTPGVYEEDEAPGPFLMRFGSNGELLMGTRLFAEQQQGLGHRTPAFALGEQSATAISIGIHLDLADAIVEPTTPDAPMANRPGNADLFISQFDSNGNRLFGTYWGGNLYDYHVELVAEEDQFTGFFGYNLFQNNPWNEEPNYEITSEEVLLDYAPFQNNDSLVGLNGLKNAHVYRLSKDKSSSTDVHTQAQIKVFPNPTADVLQIHLGGATMDEIVIYDTQGKEVKRFQTYGANQATIDVGQLSRGVYLLHLKGGQYTENIHFVKK